MTKNKFIKLVEKEKIEEQLTYTDTLKAHRKKTIGADGVSIALTINWLKRDLKELKPRNRRSRNKLIKWLKSEMRYYAEYGSYNALVLQIVNYYYLCLNQQRRKELDKKLSENKTSENKGILNS